MAGGGEEVGEGAPGDEGDGGGAGGGRGAGGGVVGGGGPAAAEPRPCDLAGEAELVEPGGVVVANAGAEKVVLPGAGGGLEALEAFEGAAEAGAAAVDGAGGESLPAGEEAHVVGAGDGGDGLAQPLEGVAVDTGKEAAVAELILRGVGSEAAADQEAGSFRCAEAVVCVLLGQTRAAADVGGGEGPEALGVAPHEGEAGGLAVLHLQQGVRGDAGGGDVDVGEEEADRGEVLDGEPEGALASVEPGRSSPGLQLGQPLAPGSRVLPGKDDEPEEGVVRFLGIAGLGPGLLANAGDRVGAEGGEVAGGVGEGLAEGDGAGAAFLDRGVVEVGVGPPADYLVGHGGGLDGVDGMEADGAVLDAGEHVLKAVHVHGLVEAVVAGLAHEGVVGEGEGLVEVLLAADLGGEDRGHEVVAAHALEEGGHALAVALAGDGERPGGVPAPARGEEGDVEDGLLHERGGVAGVHPGEGLGEGPRVLGPGG